MLFAVVIWILKILTASPESISELFPKLVDEKSIAVIRDLNIISYFDTFSNVVKALFWAILAIELLIEFTLFIKWFPSYINRKFVDFKNRSIKNVETIKAILYKRDNNMRLSKREIKFLNKHTKGGEYE